MRRSPGFLLLALSLGCATAPSRPTAPEGPIKAVSLTVTEQTLTGFTVTLDLAITNRSASSWTLQAADTELWVDGILSASNHGQLSQVIPAGGTLELKLPASAEPVKDEASLRSWTSRGDRPVPLVLKGAIQLAGGNGIQDLPFSHAGELRAPRLPVPKMDDAEVARYDSGEIGVSFFLGVENQNPFPIHLRSITYHATLAGQLIAEGFASSGDKVPASQTAEYEIDARLDKEHGGELSKLADEGKLTYRLDGEIDLGLTHVPIELSGPLTLGKKGTHHATPSAPAAPPPGAE